MSSTRISTSTKYFNCFHLVLPTSLLISSLIIIFVPITRGLSITNERGERKLFGGYRITPKYCGNPSQARSHDGLYICMFNHECAQRGGDVIGACMDGFLFGACCHVPNKKGITSSTTESNLYLEQDIYDQQSQINGNQKLPSGTSSSQSILSDDSLNDVGGDIGINQQPLVAISINNNNNYDNNNNNNSNNYNNNNNNISSNNNIHQSADLNNNIPQNDLENNKIQEALYLYGINELSNNGGHKDTENLISSTISSPFITKNEEIVKYPSKYDSYTESPVKYTTQMYTSSSLDYGQNSEYSTTDYYNAMTSQKPVFIDADNTEKNVEFSYTEATIPVHALDTSPSSASSSTSSQINEINEDKYVLVQTIKNDRPTSKKPFPPFTTNSIESIESIILMLNDTKTSPQYNSDISSNIATSPLTTQKPFSTATSMTTTKIYKKPTSSFSHTSLKQTTNAEQISQNLMSSVSYTNQKPSTRPVNLIHKPTKSSELMTPKPVSVTSSNIFSGGYDFEPGLSSEQTKRPIPSTNLINQDQQIITYKPYKPTFNKKPGFVSNKIDYINKYESTNSHSTQTERPSILMSTNSDSYQKQPTINYTNTFSNRPSSTFNIDNKYGPSSPLTTFTLSPTASPQKLTSLPNKYGQYNGYYQKPSQRPVYGSSSSTQYQSMRPYYTPNPQRPALVTSASFMEALPTTSNFNYVVTSRPINAEVSTINSFSPSSGKPATLNFMNTSLISSQKEPSLILSSTDSNIFILSPHTKPIKSSTKPPLTMTWPSSNQPIPVPARPVIKDNQIIVSPTRRPPTHHPALETKLPSTSYIMGPTPPRPPPSSMFVSSTIRPSQSYQGSTSANLYTTQYVSSTMRPTQSVTVLQDGAYIKVSTPQKPSPTVIITPKPTVNLAGQRPTYVRPSAASQLTTKLPSTSYVFSPVVTRRPTISTTTPAGLYSTHYPTALPVSSYIDEHLPYLENISSGRPSEYVSLQQIPQQSPPPPKQTQQMQSPQQVQPPQQPQPSQSQLLQSQPSQPQPSQSQPLQSYVETTSQIPSTQQSTVQSVQSNQTAPSYFDVSESPDTLENIEEETYTSPNDFVDFPPVRNPNANLSASTMSSITNEFDLSTPSFVEDNVLKDKMHMLVNKIVQSLQGNFEILTDIVEGQNNTTDQITGYESEIISTTFRPYTTRRTILTTKQIQTKIPTKLITKAPTKSPSKIQTQIITRAPTKVPTRKSTKTTRTPTIKSTKASTKTPTRTSSKITQTKAPITQKPISTKKPQKVVTKKPSVSKTKKPIIETTVKPNRQPTTTVTKRPQNRLTTVSNKRPQKRPTKPTRTTTAEGQEGDDITEDSSESISQFTTSAEVHQRQFQCGTRPHVKSGRIVGGKSATFGEWPWQVLVRESTWLGLFTKNKCGGVLITNKFVITAAHCQPGFLASLVAVFGEFDISNEKENKRAVTKNVKRVIVHRQYDAKTFENDLALLELENPIHYDTHIIPICMPPDDAEYVGRMATVTGWGRLKYAGGVPSILQEVQVPVIENSVCQEMFSTAGHTKQILPSFLCAGYANGQKDSCEGDSGGPLVLQRDDGRWELIGTVSHGIKCAAPYLPGVYMRTSYYKPWIKSVTGSIK